MIPIVTRKVFLRPTRSPIRPNTSAPNGRTAKPGGERAQRQDEPGGLVDAREELLGNVGREQAVEVEVVPFEHGAERRRADDELVVLGRARLIGMLGGHRSSLPRVRRPYQRRAVRDNGYRLGIQKMGTVACPNRPGFIHDRPPRARARGRAHEKCSWRSFFVQFSGSARNSSSGILMQGSRQLLAGST